MTQWLIFFVLMQQENQKAVHFLKVLDILKIMLRKQLDNF